MSDGNYKLLSKLLPLSKWSAIIYSFFWCVVKSTENKTALETTWRESRRAQGHEHTNKEGHFYHINGTVLDLAEILVTVVDQN